MIRLFRRKRDHYEYHWVKRFYYVNDIGLRGQESSGNDYGTIGSLGSQGWQFKGIYRANGDEWMLFERKSRW